MVPETSDPDDTQPAADPAARRFERYSHMKTESGDIIYDTEAADGWLQADRSLALDEWE